jgi:phage/plasmid-like protein (TIGR03299 family)
MAWVEERPWHNLGVKVPASVPAEQMIGAAGLAWKVELEPAQGARLIRRHPETYDRCLIMREPLDSEQDAVVLGMVSGRYKPLQNAEAFEFFEPFIGNGWATFETAGALGKGERVWVLAKLSGQIEVIPGDTVDRYLLLSNTHDGKGAVSIRFTPIRVVCQNTLNWAEEGGVSVLRVRHSRRIAEHLKKAQAIELKQIVEKVFSEAETLFGNMAAREIEIKDEDQILEALYPRTERQKRLDEEPERWALVHSVLENERLTPPATRKTLWGFYNAIVRTEDYRDSRQDGSGRLERVWFGSGHDLKVKALNLARQQLARAA